MATEALPSTKALGKGTTRTIHTNSLSINFDSEWTNKFL